MLRLSTNRRAGLSVLMMILVAAAFTAAQDPERQTTAAPGAKAPAAQQSVARQVRAAEQRIRRALQNEVTLEFKDEPLQEALRELTRESGVPLWIDALALSEEGISLDEPVSADLDSMSIETVLELILSRLGLAWYIEHEVLKVTTEAEESERLSTEVYDVSELLRLAEQAEQELSGADLDLDGATTPVQFCAGVGMVDCLTGAEMAMSWPGKRPHWLVALLMAMTSGGGGWEDIDGVGGTAKMLNGALVVRQTRRVHGEILGLLDALTRAARGELTHGSATVHPPGAAANRIQRIDHALSRKGTAEFEDTTLRGALASLSTQFDVPVIINEVALTEEGVSLGEPVRLNVQGVTLHSLLKLLLDPLGLTAIVRFGVLEITTETEAFEYLVTGVYDISDLTRAGLETTNLLDAIQSAVPGEWKTVDGVGGAIEVPFPGALVIRQTQRVHGQLEVLLADLRRTLQRGEQNGAPLGKKRRGADEVTTQLYRIDLEAPIEQVSDVINMFVVGELEENAEPLTITRVGGTLMIRTTNRGHAAIRKCLELLRQAETDSHSDSPGGVYGPDDWQSGGGGSFGGSSGGGFFSMGS